jgi:hypothetical protein
MGVDQELKVKLHRVFREGKINQHKKQPNIGNNVVHTQGRKNHEEKPIDMTRICLYMIKTSLYKYNKYTMHKFMLEFHDFLPWGCHMN